MEFPILLIVIIALALIFDYINGFHDAANAIATIVSTKVLTPFQAVLWAAFWNFAAFFVAAYLLPGGFKIGNTIAKTVSENYITLEVIFAGIVAGNILELAHLVVWDTIFFFSYLDWRILRGCTDARSKDRLSSRSSITPRCFGI
ncbi:hypothetical protein BPO_0084 [Bergeyella porcorum]|uniref:Inorganic phosphate transporter n=1 Tax=Bergeyella porcorum TaxID=1735111 RepID=A0AAU0EYG3_9FLAO